MEVLVARAEKYVTSIPPPHGLAAFNGLPVSFFFFFFLFKVFVILFLNFRNFLLYTSCNIRVVPPLRFTEIELLKKKKKTQIEKRKQKIETVPKPLVAHPS
jgi:hypothetical protein